MKTLMKVRLLLIAITVTFVACTKTPEACIEASNTTVEVGQEITFTNCSLDSKNTEVDFGDDNTKSNVSTSCTHAYATAGTYQVKLTAKSKDKSDEALVSVTVNKIEESDLKGEWNMYQQGYFSDDSDYWGFWGLGYESEDEFTPMNVEYEFTENFVTYSSSYCEYSLSSKGVLTIGNNIYQVVKLYNDEMIWKDDYNTYYYLEKK